ncbi:MAG: glycoside hydrolase family 2 [Clostridiales bacterium]|nr:glycoside hydrolase family 2 [Clostridiales bacterium]
MNAPFNEYPRPQLRREHWQNLNGEWRLTVLNYPEKGQEQDFLITVPFSPESELSNVKIPSVTPEQTLIYEREFSVRKEDVLDKVLLHFGAVDATASVRINGGLAGEHTGGFTPFTLDITPFLREGENTLTVTVTDPTETAPQGRGKQLLNPSGIWYTAQSGIWQTVWLESVVSEYVQDITVRPLFDESAVWVAVQSKAPEITLQVLDGEEVIASYTGAEKTVTLPIPNFIAWSPENPKLYGLKITAGRDTVSSYFGMRKFSVESAEKGSKAQKRFYLNGKPYFLTGVLDQGYYKQGLLTPPDEDTVLRDLQMLKEMGFNCLRKHIKVEPLRFYYLCDKLGLLVMQDFVNGGDPYRFSVVALRPFLHILTKDDKYEFFGRADEWGRNQFNAEARETVSALKNAVSICTWVPFNEGWGQFDAKKAYEWVKEIDPTRTVDSVSGWHDQGDDSSDFFSIHNYFTRLRVPKSKRAVILSEFGGYSMCVNDEGFGYRKYADKQELTAALTKLYEKKVAPLVNKGLSGAIYTQLSDVESEINGLITYDRTTEKVDRALMKKLNSLLTQGN